MEKEFEELKHFVEDTYQKLYHRPQFIKLNRETDIEKDLGITGDFAGEFIDEFIKKFKVDYSDFDSRKYFGYDDAIIINILRFIIGQRKWMPLPKKKRKPLTLGMLEKAIKEGKL